MIGPLEFSLSPVILTIAAALLTGASVGSEPELIKAGLSSSRTGTMTISERHLINAVQLPRPWTTTLASAVFARQAVYQRQDRHGLAR